MKIETLLHEEIQSELEDLRKMELGSEPYKITVDGISKLIGQAIEIEKFEVEHGEQVESRENDNYFKTKQIENDQRNRWIDHGIAIAGIVIPTMVTIWGFKKSVQFEKEGTFTTIMGRGFVNKLLPKK